MTFANFSRPRLPAPGYPDEAYPVGRCLSVIMGEECEHRCYAVRDLAVLEGPPAFIQK
jgi:hypothetical protein